LSTIGQELGTGIAVLFDEFTDVQDLRQKIVGLLDTTARQHPGIATVLLEIIHGLQGDGR
jgi:hypothetical protein